MPYSAFTIITSDTVSHPVQCRNDKDLNSDPEGADTKIYSKHTGTQAGTLVLNTHSLNSHILYCYRLTKQHNPLLQPKTYNSVVVSIYNGAYFLPTKTFVFLLAKPYEVRAIFIFLTHLWPKKNRQIILLIQVVLLLSEPINLRQQAFVQYLFSLHELTSTLIDTLPFFLP